MRCKNYFRARKCFEYLSPGGDPEQALDEYRLPSRVASRYSLDLSLPHQVSRLDAFYCLFRGAEALRRPPSELVAAVRADAEQDDVGRLVAPIIRLSPYEVAGHGLQEVLVRPMRRGKIA